MVPIQDRSDYYADLAQKEVKFALLNGWLTEEEAKKILECSNTFTRLKEARAPRNHISLQKQAEAELKHAIKKGWITERRAEKIRSIHDPYRRLRTARMLSDKQKNDGVVGEEESSTFGKLRKWFGSEEN